ncbi:MAG: TetR/AcrR family transcriptional regulator [Alphaproteobacteria bacterium]|nr:TetR/AcrR family transcriptional regulator [Alphaproteobacteria bacterium]
MRDGTKTRERIEAAALRLFVEKGVAETSVRDIAQSAGVAEGALYRHHAGKDDLVWSLFHTHYTEFAATLDALQRPEAGLERKIAAMVGGFCRLFDADRTLFSFLLLAQHGQLAKLAPETATPITVVGDVIARALKAGEIAPGDPDLLTAMVVGIVLQTATFRIYGRITPPLSALVPDLSAACWSVLDRPRTILTRQRLA